MSETPREQLLDAIEHERLALCYLRPRPATATLDAEDVLIPCRPLTPGGVNWQEGINRLWELWTDLFRAVPPPPRPAPDNYDDALEAVNVLHRALDRIAPPKEKPATKSKRKRRRAPEREPSPITGKQAEALKLYGEHQGNFTAAAKAMGISRTALK
jgi:hypothetical protein